MFLLEEPTITRYERQMEVVILAEEMMIMTHYTTMSYVGAINAKSNAVTSNGSTYLKLFDDILALST